MNYTHDEAQQYAKLVVREAEGNRFDAPKTEMLAREVIRLNEWADGMTDAALKERATSDAFIKELQAKLSARPEALRSDVLEEAVSACLQYIERLEAHKDSAGFVTGPDFNLLEIEAVRNCVALIRTLKTIPSPQREKT